MTQDRVKLDELLASPTRLAIVALLASSHWAEFSFVRNAVSTTDSALSKQISILCAKEYIEVKKGYVGRRPRTWLNITDSGRQVLEAHVAALQEIVAQASEHTVRLATPNHGS